MATEPTRDENRDKTSNEPPAARAAGGSSARSGSAPGSHPSTDRGAFTGRARRQTRPAVRWADRVARGLIAVGGIGTIVAVLMVCVFLVWVVLPLFAPARLSASTRVSITSSSEEGVSGADDNAAKNVVQIGVDEYETVGWSLKADGRVQAFQLETGKPWGDVLEIRGEAEGDAGQLTAWSLGIDGEHGAFGFADGSVRLGRIRFVSTSLEKAEQPAAFGNLEIGKTIEHESPDGPLLIERVDADRFRSWRLEVSLEVSTAPVAPSAITQIALVQRSEGPVFVARAASGAIYFNAVRKRVNLLTDEETLDVASVELPRPPLKEAQFLLVSGLGDQVIVADHAGRLVRYDVRNFEAPRLAEEVDLLPDSDASLTALHYLLGGSTLVAGDSQGRVQAWFGAKPPGAKTADGIVLVMGHTFPDAGAPISTLAMSSRSRMVAAGTTAGRVRLLYMTSDKVLADAETNAEEKTADFVNVSGAQPIRALAISPKATGLVAMGDQTLHVWKIDPAYPEISLSSLFRPVWYEGYSGPTHSWQSSSGSDAFESKFSLMPLVFGTLKATLFSMLFGAPIALLAAIYTSEFLSPRMRSRVKPTIEMMASLPSVVLGFLAGLVIAPAVESIVPAVLAAIFTVPVALLAGAHLWQLIPAAWAVRLAPWRFLGILIAIPLGLLAATELGPTVERQLFAGDLKGWLTGRVGGAVPGWMILLLPVAALMVTLLLAWFVNPWLRQRSAPWTRRQAGLIEMVKLLAATSVALVIAYVLAIALDVVGLDPRGSLVGGYVQRNALVVGFVMGFAIIPLIYTLADDALSSVPGHLRSASLGAGATIWQTAIRIVVPTAMSGLFSALMIGLGRAVGETMVVLMATGNTPIMDWNPFNGFQTLSAAIATELPEAVVGSAHYRTLFLAALTLFVITFVVNTVAEVIRQRFRRRAYEL